MTHRAHAKARRRATWAHGIRPRLDAETFGKLKMLHQSGKSGGTCKHWPDFLTELYHAGRDCAVPLLCDARAAVSGASVAHEISIKVDIDDVEAARLRADGHKRSAIAKTFAAMVRVGYLLSEGKVGCVGQRQGIYL